MHKRQAAMNLPEGFSQPAVLCISRIAGRKSKPVLFPTRILRITVPSGILTLVPNKGNDTEHKQKT